MKIRMKCSSDAHTEEIHGCIEKIINAYRQDMDTHAPKIQRSPHIALVCRDVNRILGDVIGRAAYHKGHDVEWHSSIFEHGHVLTCGVCTASFNNMVIEAARRLKKL